MHSTKMSPLVPIAASVLISFTVLISGNVIPTKFPDRWIPTQEMINSRPLESSGSVQTYPAYHQPFSNKHVRLKSSRFGADIKAHKQVSQTLDQFPLKTSQDEHVETETLPEPKPRREDTFQDKLGFGILSSLLPTSILSTSQQNQDGENQIDTAINPNYSSQPFSLPIQQQSVQDNSAGLAMPFGDDSSLSEQFSSNSESSQEETSENGLFSRIRNAIPFGSGLLSGLLSNNNDEAGGNEQYGYDDSSALHNMPALTNDNIQGQPNFTSLFPLNPATFNLPNQDDSSLDSNANESTESGSNFLSSLPNPIESIKNLFSSFATLPDESNGQYPPASEEGPFSLNPGQISLTNLQDSSSLTNNPTESENNYLSSFSNPIDTLRNLFSRITGAPPVVNNQPLESDGGYVDSAITPLESLTDGGLNGALGAVVPYLSHFIKLFGLVKAKLPFVKILGAVLGPILSAAIAAMVVGIVYVAIYISAAVIQNRDVEGEVFFLSLKQLLNILGIPDPLEDITDAIFGRSFQERSIKSLTLDPIHPLNITNENYKCIERIACHAIGKKLFNFKPSWKKGWFGKGIKWISGNVNPENWDMTRKKSNFYINYMQSGKSVIDAIAIGMEPHAQSVHNKNSIIGNNSVCTKYACEPIIFMKQLF